MVVLQKNEDPSTVPHLLLLLHEVVDNLPMNAAMTKIQKNLPEKQFN